MVSMYYPNVNNITVIFWDLNNLKIINDTYGHEYGDKALSALEIGRASCRERV